MLVGWFGDPERFLTHLHPFIVGNEVVEAYRRLRALQPMKADPVWVRPPYSQLCAYLCCPAHVCVSSYHAESKVNQKVKMQETFWQGELYCGRIMPWLEDEKSHHMSISFPTGPAPTLSLHSAWTQGLTHCFRGEGVRGEMKSSLPFNNYGRF